VKPCPTEVETIGYDGSRLLRSRAATQRGEHAA